MRSPVFTAVPFVQRYGTTSLHEWGVTACIARFVRSPAHSRTSLTSLPSLARIRLTNSSTNNTSHPQTTTLLAPAPPPPSASRDVILSPITTRFRHRTRFQAAAIRLLEHFTQDTSQSARKRESWARIAHVVDETESG